MIPSNRGMSGDRNWREGDYTDMRERGRRKKGRKEGGRGKKGGRGNLGQVNVHDGSQQ